MREAQRPAILVATATPAPTLPPTPTATAMVEVVYIEGPTPEPQVIYVEAQPQVVYVEAPAAPEQPAPVPSMAPQMMVLYDRQQWAQQAAGR
jgi:hypothetical protein